MQYRNLGKSDLRVSTIGFGCWETGGEYGAYDETDVVAAVHRSLDLGVTLFDTARGYGFGRSEELLARALGAHRQDVVVVTKLGLEKNPDGTYRRDSSRTVLLDGIEQSLRALRTDAVDLLLIHWPDRTRSWEEPMETLAEIRKMGKARHVGVSNFHAADLLACAALTELVTDQVGYNLFDRRWEREVFSTAEQLGIGIMAYGPMAHGLLTGRFSPSESFQTTDWRSRGDAFGQPLLTPEHLPANVRVVERLQELARERGMSVAQLAITWVLQNPLVAVAITGVRTPGEIEHNAGAADRRLDEETMAAIETVMQEAKGLSATVLD
jgi:aryl-alcohol dehydrogenase-like predicted oxidoreductase